MTVCNLYVIYDSIAKEAGAPFDAKNDEIAKRKFEDVINRQIRPVKTVSLSDYELRQVGSFNAEQCCITPYQGEELPSLPFRFVCRGDEVNLWPENHEESDLVDKAYKKIMEAMKNNPGMLSDTALNPVIKSKKRHWWSK